jgi:hypothetical protein
MVSETESEATVHVASADMYRDRDDFWIRLANDQHGSNFSTVAGL